MDATREVSVPGSGARRPFGSLFLWTYKSIQMDLPQKEISTRFRSLNPSVFCVGLQDDSLDSFCLGQSFFVWSLPTSSLPSAFFFPPRDLEASPWKHPKALCHLVSFEAIEALARGQRVATEEGQRICLQIPLLVCTSGSYIPVLGHSSCQGGCSETLAFTGPEMLFLTPFPAGLQVLIPSH